MTVLNRRDALKLASIGAAAVVGTTVASAAQAAVEMKGIWKYQSYRPEPGSLARDRNSPTFVVWSPPGVVTIDNSGTFGKLEFLGTRIKLDLTINIADESPRRLSASAVMELGGGQQFTNELQGWFVPAKLGHELGDDNRLVVRGCVIQTSKDIDPTNPQPIYTTGFFVLERSRDAS